MSDFKTIQDFRKGSISKYPYQDPTYLSFVLMFNFHDKENSPLLSGPAEDFIKGLAGTAKDEAKAEAEVQKNAEEEDKLISGVGASFYEDRLADLTTFIESLKLINKELPWYWQSLGGLSRIMAHDPNSPYLGGDEAVLEIETLESLNLPIAGLMHLYRRAIFDERKWAYILPKNLRKFKMIVYVTEVRQIQSVVSMSSTASGGEVKNPNADIMGPGNRPFFAAFLKYCEFDMSRGTALFDSLSKNPEVAANNIAITYEALEKIEARALNGMIKKSSQTLTRMNGYLSPAPDAEALEVLQTPEEKKSNFFSRLVDRFKKNPLGNVYGDTLLERVANRNLDRLNAQASSDLRKFGKEKVLELQGSAVNFVRGRTQSNENIFGNAISRLDASNNTDPGRQAADVARAINDNVYGDAGGISARDALDAAATAAVINLGNAYE